MTDAKDRGSWLHEGYGKPKGDAEQRVEMISTTYRSMNSDKLKRALMQLETLTEDGDMRVGYTDRARRLHRRILKRLKDK